MEKRHKPEFAIKLIKLINKKVSRKKFRLYEAFFNEKTYFLLTNKKKISKI